MELRRTYSAGECGGTDEEKPSSWNLFGLEERDVSREYLSEEAIGREGLNNFSKRGVQLKASREAQC